MPIKKQEFYEGAALHLLVRNAGREGVRISYVAPFFLLNGAMQVYFKYTRGGRSPWSFSFTAKEQRMLATQRHPEKVVIALICGGDGVAALSCTEFLEVVEPRPVAVHVGCVRLHGEHYEVKGPTGRLAGKVSPSRWHRLLSPRGAQ